MNVLVTDGNNRVALAVVRALGRAGARVTVVEQDRFARCKPPAFASRFVSRSEIVPSLEREEEFIEALVRLAADADVVIPVSTNVLLACARFRERFSARLPIPPLETIRRANDKSSVLEVARRAGVPAPVSYAPATEGELEDVKLHVRYPAVVKLRDDEGTYLEPARRYAVCNDVRELSDAYAALHLLRPFPVIQEKIEGEGYGVGILAKDGRVLASLCYRRVREYPVGGGPSAACETVNDPRLAEHAAAVIRELGWTGVAMVEFRKGDDYRLLEINPRFWGALPLALAAGVNFPHLLCRMAMGEEFDPVTAYPAGIRLRFFAMDARAAWQACFSGKRGAGYVWGFLRDLVNPAVKDGIFDRHDLRASFAYFLGKFQ